MDDLLDYISDEPLKTAIIRTGKLIEQNEWLLQLTERLEQLLFDESGTTSYWNCYLEHKAEIDSLLEEDKDCYLAYVSKVAFPRLQQYYARLGIPHHIMAATLADIDLRAHNYRMMFGGVGIDDYRWMTNHITGRIFQIGRLQYIYSRKFAFNSRIYRHRQSGLLLKIAEGNLFVDEQGFITNEQQAVFQTTLIENEHQVTGNIIDEKGNITNTRVEIAYANYENVVQSGDAVIDIHIPASGKMEYNDCLASLEAAFTFAQTYFPDMKFRGFVCSSWLLSDEVMEMLPETSNLVRFSGSFIRCAGRHSDHELIYKWIFGMDKEKHDYKSHVPITTLQRGTHQLLDQGRWFEKRTGFITPEVFL
ncbi:acyltransferase domain-containing protein [Paenibacillus yanchengensis]|uniref:Acyltransferase domain-containing protein n=1 Tax=Paenibacillus yanchengensis TaxID=2035833 RepID=A0ABW4YNZ5_9BACL